MAGFWQIQLYPFFWSPCFGIFYGMSIVSSELRVTEYTVPAQRIPPGAGKPAVALSNEKLFRYHISHVLTDGYVKCTLVAELKFVATVATGGRINFLTHV